MNIESNIQYKDPFLLSVFGVIIISIGVILLFRHRRKIKKILENEPATNLSFWKSDPILMILFGLALNMAAIGLYEPLAAIIVILIILYKLLF